MGTKQTSFSTPIERTREVLARAERQGLNDHVTILAVSGGTDSIVAADLMCRIGPEYGFTPDTVVHVNTGASVPQSRLAARVIAEKWGLNWMEQGHRNPQDSLAARILDNGWPGGYVGSPWTGGHGLEWANRKAKPMDAAYMEFEGQQTWVSGVRKLESKRRSGNVADGAIDRDKPRRTWLSPIVGWTDADKRDYIKKHDLPVSQAYLVLGFSAECVACSFDDTGLLTDLELLAPELAHALRSLAVWLYMRVRRGDVELEPKRLCWGWEPKAGVGDVEQTQVEKTITMPREEDVPDSETSARIEMESPTQKVVGCNAGSCSTRNSPEWIRDLPPRQIVDWQDVTAAWDGGFDTVVERFA